MKRQFVSVAEFMAATGLAKSTTLNHIRDGIIPAARLGGKLLIPTTVLDQLREQAGCPRVEAASAG